MIGDDELFQRESTGTVCDRTALFACALADPELLDLWQDISRPNESDARPGEPIPSLTPCHAPSPSSTLRLNLMSMITLRVLAETCVSHIVTSVV